VKRKIEARRGAFFLAISSGNPEVQPPPPAPRTHGGVSSPYESIALYGMRSVEQLRVEGLGLGFRV